MSTTRKMGSGLAFTPEKDLAMFADMARRGKHLDGVSQLGHGWRFTDGEPEDAIFDLTHESDPSPDYFDIFRGAGWTPVLSMGDLHIFKAARGTPPVHTSDDSRRVELTEQRNLYLRYSAVALVVFLLVVIGLSRTSWHVPVETAVFVTFFIPVAYTVVPLYGYSTRLAKLGRDD